MGRYHRAYVNSIALSFIEIENSLRYEVKPNTLWFTHHSKNNSINYQKDKMNPVGHRELYTGRLRKDNPVTHGSARIQFLVLRNYKSLILSFCVTGDVNAQNLKNKSDEVIDYL